MSFRPRRCLYRHGAREDRSGAAAGRARDRGLAGAGRTPRERPAAPAPRRVAARPSRESRAGSTACRPRGPLPSSRNLRMKRRLLIAGLILAALLLATYGLAFGPRTPA